MKRIFTVKLTGPELAIVIESLLNHNDFESEQEEYISSQLHLRLWKMKALQVKLTQNRERLQKKTQAAKRRLAAQRKREAKNVRRK
jgi:hypothetical protein